MERAMEEKMNEREEIEDLKKSVGMALNEISALRYEIDKLRRKVIWMEIENS